MYCCRHGLINVLMPSLLPWLPLVACFLQDHVFLSSGSPLLPQFDQARILLSSWLPDCRCFTFMFRSMYSCRHCHCFHSCRWFKITGIHGCGCLPGMVLLPLELFLVPLVFGNSRSDLCVAIATTCPGACFVAVMASSIAAGSLSHSNQYIEVYLIKTNKLTIHSVLHSNVEPKIPHLAEK